MLIVSVENMDTTSLATTFPFTSSELTMETGIVYGINEHNDSLVIFDRFKMENANMAIFAKSELANLTQQQIFMTINVWH